MADKTWKLKIDADGRGAFEEVDDVERRFRKIDINKGFRQKLDKMSDQWKKSLGGLVGKGKPLAVVAGTAFSLNFIGAVVSGLASGAGKVAHGVGAIAALLPAAAVAGVLAFGALKIAVSGVGDAIKAGLAGDTEAWNEAMKGLSQSGQEFARAVASLRPQLDGLKKSVQENFFEQFDERVRRLALTWLPILENNLKLVARGFGQAAAESIKILQSRPVVSALGEALSNARVAVGNLTAGIPNLVAAFIPLVTVGASFLPNLTGGFERATARLAEFMRNAERTGRLREFIQSGLDKLRELWETAKQLGRIFSNIAGIANKIFPNMGDQAGGLLDVIERVTGRFNSFLETTRGESTAGTIFNTLKTLVESFFGTLQLLAQTLGQAFAPALPHLAEFLGKLAELKGQLITGLKPAFDLLAQGIIGVLSGLSWLMDFIMRNKAAMAALKGVVIALFVAWAVNAALAAGATLLAAAPLILLGIAVGVLAYLVHKHFDAIKGWIETAFNWVKENWPLLVAILAGPFAPIVLIIITHFNTIKGVFMGFVAVVLALWNTFGATILTYVRSVWDAVWQIIQGVFNIIRGIVTVFMGLITGDWSRAWEGIKMIFSGVWQVIQGIVGLAVAQIRLVISIAWTTIQVITSAIWNVIVAVFRTVWALIQLVIQTGIAFITAILSAGWNLISGTVSFVWGVISGTISTVWDGIKTAVGNAIDWVQTKISDVMSVISSTWNDIWEGIRSGVSNVWEGIKSGVRTGVNAVIDVINWFIRLLNHIPGVDIGELEHVGGGGAPNRQRSGAQEHQAQRRASGGFLTNGPQFLVGEGNPAYREAVIATDPKYRRRNIALWAWAGQQLGVLGGANRGKPDSRGQRRNGMQAFLPGGIPNPIDAAGDAISGVADRVRGAASAAAGFVRDISTRALGPVRDAAKGMIDRLPGGNVTEWLKGGIKGVIDRIYNWARGKTEEHERNQAILSTAAGNNAGFHGMGGVEQWRSTALQALQMAGAPAGWIGSLLRRMQQESGGNPRATNNWDSNARRGDPSKGLMQTIGATFNAYAGHLRGRGIYDPLANIYAAIKYTIARYGSGPAGWDRAGGYRSGLRRVPRDDFPARLHRGEMVLTAPEANTVRSGGGSQRPINQVHNHFGPGSIIIEKADRQGAKLFLDELERLGIEADARYAA